MEGGDNGQNPALNGSDMTPEKAQTIGLRLGTMYGTVAVGIDASPSSPMVRAALVSGITAAGADVIDAGMAATPVLCRTYADRCDCIVAIGSPDSFGSVSGISIYGPDGACMPAETAGTLVSDDIPELPDFKGIGSITEDGTANGAYVLDIASSGLKSGGFAIVDCGCGSTSLCAPRALSETGADVVSINAHITDRNHPRAPGIAKADLANISDFVNASTGSIGIAYNGDGTKVALMDESGKFVPGDRLLALMLRYMRPKVAVIPFESPEVVEDAFWAPPLDIEGAGTDTENRRIVRAGNTLEEIIQAVRDNGADFAGLTNGSFIFPHRSLCPDGIYASAMLSCLAGQRSMRNILEELPSYYSMGSKLRFSGNIDRFGREFIRKITEYDIREVSIGDGWKVVLKMGMYFVKQDPNDPMSLRISAESQDKVYLVSMLDQASDIIRACDQD